MKRSANINLMKMKYMNINEKKGNENNIKENCRK